MKKKKEQTEINPDVIYDQHTKRDDGRCLGCHCSGFITNEVYNYIREKDFFDLAIEEGYEE